MSEIVWAKAKNKPKCLLFREQTWQLYVAALNTQEKAYEETA